jgi:hypothetical protein
MRTRFRVLFAAAATVALSAGAAQAGRVKERIYDDSFGNLIILSPSGYKRIVVGMGHIAVEMEAERRAQYSGGREVQRERCWHEPVLWKGREQMWGLADGEVPTPPLVCK